MMVVCIELRIPLFVVGKPGSSKSLAKTVVADNMQGDAARSELFKAFKQVIRLFWKFVLYKGKMTHFATTRQFQVKGRLNLVQSSLLGPFTQQYCCLLSSFNDRSTWRRISAVLFQPQRVSWRPSNSVANYKRVKIQRSLYQSSFLTRLGWQRTLLLCL